MTFFANPSGNWQPGYDAVWSEVAATGSEIGNHTWSHCHADLSGCKPVGSADEEIRQVTAYLATHLGVPLDYSFAAPFGDVGWNEYAESRFLVGRGVANGFVAVSQTVDWFNLPAIAVTSGQTAKDFNASIDSARSQGRWGIFLFHSLLPTDKNWYAGVEVREVTASIAHAKTTGDVWIDTMASIGAYARAQQLVEELKPIGHTWSWTVPDYFPPGTTLRVIVSGGALHQDGKQLSWNSHGYYEVAFDAGNLSWTP